MKTRLFPLFVGALCLLAAAPAGAQSTPAPIPTPIVLPTLPPSATNNPYVGPAIQIIKDVLRQNEERNRNNASGTVSFFRRFDMQVTTGRNAYRDVHLHQGTVIFPRGWTLKPGDNVTVNGVGQADGSLNANSITVQQ